LAEWGGTPNHVSSLTCPRLDCPDSGQDTHSVITNVFPADELAALARRRRNGNVIKSVPVSDLGAALSDGWKQVGRKKRNSVRISRQKPHYLQLEDRVWSSLYGMGFTTMSGDRGCVVELDPKDPQTPKNQVDVLAMDRDVAVAVECKSSSEPRREPRFQEELAKHAALREPLSRAIAAQFPTAERRRLVLGLFTSNIQLSDNDRARAESLNVALFDDTDLSYYEALTRQLGPAARYQFLCDLIPGKPVPGLEMTLPALKTTMGGYDCYLFSAHPEYLLKICYVSHRAKGKASDIDAYQRMVSRGRLSKIRTYILEGGIFPTNIVISVQDAERLRFDRGKQEAGSDGATFGWLHIVPTYKSAWVIDGQHRLFAYSGQPNAATAELSVLAFAGLPASKQAELFIDINGEQRRVKKNLLQDLYAELHWSSSDPHDRIAAVISKAIQQLDEDPDSPFYARILRADESRSLKRCISLTTVFRSLDRPGFYISRSKKGSIIEYGPLWAGDNEKTLRRTRVVLNDWFEQVRLLNPEWWEVGSGEGGGLAMNDGVTICINSLRNVFQTLASGNAKLFDLTDRDLAALLRPYARALGEHYRTFGPEGRNRFRELRGAQGQTRGTFSSLAGIQERIVTFFPDGLKEHLARENARTTEQARSLVDRIETTLQRLILEELREEFAGDDRWWYDGVPAQVRQKVALRQEEDQGRRGGKENYFDLIDYRSIATHNWAQFSDLIGNGTGSKDKRTEWINRVNEVRKKVMHPSSGGAASFEELLELQRYETWLHEHADAKAPNETE
jgi:DNA sulfur modification protein DndB